ncbi:hypothetical protein ACHAWT_003308 [Skeletonema menzelii]
MPRKSKKQQRPTTTPIATRRHWIYTTTTNKNGSNDTYLHQRVQRVLVRSVPSNFSYFKDGSLNGAVAAASGTIEEDAGNIVSKDESKEIQQVPHSTKLTYTQIALPPQQQEDNSNTDTSQYSSAYTKFTTLPITKDSRHAKFQFSLNYETHVPSKALISYVGIMSGGEVVGGKNESSSGYVMQLPLGKGTVIGYSPPLDEGDIVGDDGEESEEEEEEGEFDVERMKSGEVLFRVLWDGCTTVSDNSGEVGSSSSEEEKKNVVGYIEDLTLEELLPCLITQPPATTKSSSSSSSRSRSTPKTTTSNITDDDAIIIPSKILTQKALSIHKHVHATTTRKQLSLEEKMENELLPHLVILASLELRKEIAQKIRLELLLERKKRRVEMGLEQKKNGRGKGEVIVNEDGMAYQYYMRHPNQYLSSFQAPPSLPSDDEESDCEDVDMELVEGGLDDGEQPYDADAAAANGGHPKRSKTKLSKQELITYNERVEAACNFAPSKLAERVKLACSMAFEYASRKGLLEAYYVECEQRKERERIEKEKMARDATGVAAKSSAFGLGGIDGTGEVRRSGRARTSVNYNDDGTRDVDDVVAGEARKVGEFVVGSLPGENVSGGPTARYLLDVLGMMPKEEAENKEENDDGSDEEIIHEEEEGVDPFFEPSHCLIIDQLGRKHRYMSPAQIQSAIVRSIDGEIVETPKCLLDEEQAGDHHHYITDIICTTEDKKSDLPQYEPASFARCRFTPHTLMQEREEDEEDREDVAAQKQAEREAKAAARARKEERRRVRLAAEQKRNAELERAYRAKKAYELWRFRSIHGDGCTIWPQWSERAQSLLNNLFTMSRVNSVEAMMDVSSGVDVLGQAHLTAETGVNGETATTQNDEELARSLAAAADVNDSEPLAKRRRTTRRAAGGDEPVFYGGHQSMSRDQLLETLVRILRQAKPGSSSLMDLKRLVFADDYDMSRGGAVEMRKLRSALGHLIYRLGKIGRLTVDVESDSACMELLKEGALVKFVSDEPQIKEDGEVVKSEQGDDVVMSESVPLAPPVIDEHLKRQLSALEQYMCNLQHTEFSLRAALMKALDKGGKGGETLMQLSTLAIATAADETEGAADAGDWDCYLPKKKEENGESETDNANIKWNSSDHDFIGKVIFRPQTSPLRPQGADVDPNEKCHWYRVVSYAASEKAAEPVGDEKPVTNADTDARPNVIVERRMRFRAVPIAESDIDAPPVDSGMDSDDDEISFMILTEAQVKAGMEAELLHRRISTPTNGNTLSSPLQTHPFRNRAGSRVMLTPVDGQFEVIYGIITGFDLSSGKDTKNKVLILLEGGDNESLKESGAFWASVDDEGTLLSDIHPDNQQNVPSLCSQYKIDMHEYYPGSEAYSVCESVVTYLQNHAKSGPFMEPVDPIALGIPDYTTVVKSPMDISTLLKNLEEGKYSRIPPKPIHANDDEEEGTDHPVYRMAYGPFYEALMLIFDNAILYNGIQTWIGADAALLKKNVIRKIDQAVSKATWYGQASAKKSSVASGAKKSIYAEEDSDVDMYEYESDYEDEEGGGRRKARKGRSQAKRKQKHAKEDIASKAIEKPFELPEGVSGFGAGGAFPHLKVQTNVGKFSLPQNWSCRHIQEEEEVKEEVSGEEVSEEEEMLMLMQMQQEEEHGVRRSSRARNAPKSYADEVTDAPTTTPTTQSPVVIPGVEYYMMDGDVFEPAQSNGATVDVIPTVCRSRLGAEGVQETIHELFFAKLYRDHSPNAMILADGLGTYVNGSFPPFLGRVIQTDSDSNVWEIREHYLIPALRWVLRGLVKSGHLAEVDGSLSDGLLDDAAARSYFGAGIVVPSHEYYYNETFSPFDVLDEKEVLRKRRQEAAADSDSGSDEEVELSEYEKMRAERVARNAERLKLLGLA